MNLFEKIPAKYPSKLLKGGHCFAEGSHRGLFLMEGFRLFGRACFFLWSRDLAIRELAAGLQGIFLLQP